MKKKGYLSIEAVLVGTAILVLAAVVSNMVASQTNNTINEMENAVDNLIAPREGV